MENAEIKTFKCVDCNEVKIVNVEGLSTGFGYTKEGDKVCFSCCGIRDKAQMLEKGKIALYWHGGAVSNWPGTLTFRPVKIRKGRHNMGGTVTSIYFRVDGQPWSGKHVGQNTEMTHCRRITERSFNRA
jgi:hypothetical protein